MPSWWLRNFVLCGFGFDSFARFVCVRVGGEGCWSVWREAGKLIKPSNLNTALFNKGTISFANVLTFCGNPLSCFWLPSYITNWLISRPRAHTQNTGSTQKNSPTPWLDDPQLWAANTARGGQFHPARNQVHRCPFSKTLTSFALLRAM